ncbi:hypothetical protein K7432_017480 [Basidiobolus ranarum]|uniref:Uncharacterized protein n=1 Tax=Basidiobolus ranarum TaxID=34480 RepID=A0ABR2WDA5_9FUNG
MHLKLSLLLTSAVLVKVSGAIPLGRYSNGHASAMYPEESTDYSQDQTSSAQQPASVQAESESVPLLKQVFTTVTRKHDNLNSANINGQGYSDVQFQPGPSFDVEGSGVKSEQGEVEDLGSAGSSNIPQGMYDVPQDSESGLEIAPTSPMEDSSSDEALSPQTIGSGSNNESNDAQGIDESGSSDAMPFDLSSQLANTLGQSLPQQALPEQVQGNSAQAGHALSDSNQFDQAHTIDQTLYQPSQPIEQEQPSSPEEPEEPESSGSRCSRCD